MKAIIEKMRADFVLVGEDRIQSGQWTEQDYAEVGAAIKAAIEAYNADEDPAKPSQSSVISWARWLADLSAWVTAYKMICAPVNRLIELRLAERRAATKAAAGGNEPAPAQKSGSSRTPSRTGT